MNTQTKEITQDAVITPIPTSVFKNASIISPKEQKQRKNSKTSAEDNTDRIPKKELSKRPLAKSKPSRVVKNPEGRLFALSTKNPVPTIVKTNLHNDTFTSRTIINNNEESGLREVHMHDYKNDKPLRTKVYYYECDEGDPVRIEKYEYPGGTSKLISAEDYIEQPEKEHVGRASGIVSEECGTTTITGANGAYFNMSHERPEIVHGHFGTKVEGCIGRSVDTIIDFNRTIDQALAATVRFIEKNELQADGATGCYMLQTSDVADAWMKNYLPGCQPPKKNFFSLFVKNNMEELGGDDTKDQSKGLTFIKTGKEYGVVMLLTKWLYYDIKRAMQEYIATYIKNNN